MFRLVAISTRPSLKLKMDKYVDDQAFNGQGMLTFNNNNQDPPRHSQFLVYQFMNEAGVPNHPAATLPVSKVKWRGPGHLYPRRVGDANLQLNAWKIR